MSKIEKVKEIMGLGENFHMCDVSEIAEDHIHLESWDEDVNKSDFDLVSDLHVIACLRGLAVYRNARVVARLVCNRPALDEPGNLQIFVQTHDGILLSK